MTYRQTNKKAWEEAFKYRINGYGENNYERLQTEQVLSFFHPDVREKLKAINFQGKTIAQFCCNNGRELLSLMPLGAESGVGFDIAENIIAQAKETAEKAKITNCQFVACDILEIDESYHQSFDLILFTIGALTWFKELNLLFEKVTNCLKPGGMVIIHDFHPMMGMLALPEEPDFDKAHLDRLVHSYFRVEPWLENEGMGYISGAYKSQTFTSFSHTLSSIINNLSQVGIYVQSFDEYDYDVGLSEVYDGRGYPLSFILVAKSMT
jgi:ubiquinone/menaquinone biosynthesis C-methylase UbiE